MRSTLARRVRRIERTRATEHPADGVRILSVGDPAIETSFDGLTIITHNLTSAELAHYVRIGTHEAAEEAQRKDIMRGMTDAELEATEQELRALVESGQAHTSLATPTPEEAAQARRWLMRAYEAQKEGRP